MRQANENEYVICYGDYPHIYENLIINNPCYRHLKYFWKIKHDVEEYDAVWDNVDRIFIINLNERQDRYIETLRELKRFNVPLSKVERFSAFKEAPTDNNQLNGYIGCARSHLAILRLILERQYNNALILEDDVTFTENISLNIQNLKLFFETKI